MTLALLLCVVVVSVAGMASTLDIGKGSLLVWSEKVDEPLPPENLEAEFHHSIPTITLTWSPVAGADYYRVYRQGGGAGPEPIADRDTESYDDTAIEEGVEYSYFVTTVSDHGLESQPSDSVTVLAAEEPVSAEASAGESKPDAEPRGHTARRKAPSGQPAKSSAESEEPASPARGGPVLTSEQAIGAASNWAVNIAQLTQDVDGCAAVWERDHWILGCETTGPPYLITVCVIEDPRVYWQC